MSVQVIGERIRRARKSYACSMCGARIHVDDYHHVSTNAWEGRVYNWRTCQPCERDRVVTLALDWTGWQDEGVDWSTALDWASETVYYGTPSVSEYASARNYLARVCGGEGE